MDEDHPLPLWAAADVLERREGVKAVALPPPQPAPKRPKAPRRKRKMEEVPTAEIVPLGLHRHRGTVHDLVRAWFFDRPEHRSANNARRLDLMVERLVRIGMAKHLAERERDRLARAVMLGVRAADGAVGDGGVV